MNKTGIKIIASLAACILLIVTGCDATGTAADNSLEKVLESKQFILGQDGAFPPMGYLDENGEVVGFDIDVAREVCNRLGVELVIKTIDWDYKEDDLNSGEIDCIWNGFSITPERTETMCLSDPYMNNGLIIIVPEDSDIQGVNDLDGITIAAQSGATAQDVLEASDFYDKITVKLCNTAEEVFVELGSVDAILVDSIGAFHFIFESDETFYILPNSLADEEYAIGFRKGDQKLRDKVQEIISEMKSDGTLGEISKKWFGSDITIVK